MEKFIITTGKTLDLAIAAALEELKLDRNQRFGGGFGAAQVRFPGFRRPACQGQGEL